MAFGNKVTEISQVATGTVGYVIRIDTTSILSYNVTAVQAQAAVDNTPAPSEAEVSLVELMSYVNDTEAPDLAFHYGYGEVYIFFKTSVFPYVDDTRFILIGRRNPVKITYLEQKIDIPDKDMELFIAYCIKYSCLFRGEPIPQNIAKIIRDKELEIKNANS